MDLPNIITEETAVKSQKLVTDSLGFELSVEIIFGDFTAMGAHRTYEEVDSGKVQAGTPHKIEIRDGMPSEELVLTASHEVYHLFRSIRHLITVDEETEAETFGELVRMIFEIQPQRS